MSIGKQKSKSSSKPLTAADLSGYFNELDAQTGGSHTGPTTATRWVPDAGMPAADPNNPASMLYGGKGGENWTDSLTGGGHYETVTTPGSDSPGRLSEWAQNGTPRTEYRPAHAYVTAPQTQPAPAASPEAVQAAQARYWFVGQPRELQYQQADQAPAVAYQELSPAALAAVGGMGATRSADALRARQAALEQIGSDAALDVFQRARQRQSTNADYSNRLDDIAKETEAAISQLASTEHGRTLQANQFNASNTLQNNQFNAEQRSRTDENNAARSLQANIFNATVGNNTDQFNAGLRQQTNQFNTSNTLQSDQFNAQLMQSASEANANRAAAAAALNQQAALTESGRSYTADVANAQLTRDDLLALAQIFFGGKGSTSGSNSSGFNFGFQSLPKT